MRRILLFLISTLICVSVYAVTPGLAVERVFERRDLRKAGVSMIYKNEPGNYFRSIEAKKNPELIKYVLNLVNEDKKRAYNSVEVLDDYGRSHIILNIKHEKKLINIGFFWKDSGNMKLFLQTDHPEIFSD